MRKRNLLLNVSGLGVLLIASSGAMAHPQHNGNRFEGPAHHSSAKAAYVHQLQRARHAPGHTRHHEWRPGERYRHMLREQRRQAKMAHRMSHRRYNRVNAHYRWHRLQAAKAHHGLIRKHDIKRWHKRPDARLRASRDRNSERGHQRNRRGG